MLTPRTESLAPTLLIVDTHERVRKAVRDWLTIMFPRFNCLEVSSGEQAIAVCGVQKPDIVLIDVHLPQMSGVEVTRRIKKTSPQSHVVMLVSHEALDYQEDSLDAGASAVVHKREMATDLIPIMKNLLPPDLFATLNQDQP